LLIRFPLAHQDERVLGDSLYYFRSVLSMDRPI